MCTWTECSMTSFPGQNSVIFLSKIPVSSALHASSECALSQAGCAAVASFAGAGYSVGFPLPSYQAESSAAGAWSHLSPGPETEPVPAAAAAAGAGRAEDAADGADAGTSLEGDTKRSAF